MNRKDKLNIKECAECIARMYKEDREFLEDKK